MPHDSASPRGEGLPLKFTLSRLMVAPLLIWKLATGLRGLPCLPFYLPAFEPQASVSASSPSARGYNVDVALANFHLAEDGIEEMGSLALR